MVRESHLIAEGYPQFSVGMRSSLNLHKFQLSISWRSPCIANLTCTVLSEVWHGSASLAAVLDWAACVVNA